MLQPATSKSRSLTDAKQQAVRILSIDGGGIRGIIPATIVAYLEQKLQQKTADPETRIADYFDLIAGTSTGGILSCAYLNPSPNYAKGRPMTAEAALELYTKYGDRIFSRPTARKWMSIFGLLDEKYSVRNIEQLMKTHFGEENCLSDLIKPCLITSYDITQRKAMFFDQINAKLKKDKNFKIWEVARSTSAAPTYFEPAKIKSVMGNAFPLIDGGLFANNPAMCAYIEAHKTAFSQIDTSRQMPDHPLCNEMLIVSIGTGSVSQAYEYDKMKDAGKINWIRPIIDIMMSASSETVDYQLQQVFNTCQHLQGDVKNNYYRLKPKLGDADSAMDNVDPTNLTALHQAGLDYIKKNQEKLDEIVDRLIAE
jgi:patatin-like phospholipase/acyl hydrolase